MVKEPCKAFVPLADNSALRINKSLIKPRVTNVFEMTLYPELVEDGNVSFVYTKKSALVSGAAVGALEFEVDGIRRHLAQGWSKPGASQCIPCHYILNANKSSAAGPVYYDVESKNCRKCGDTNFSYPGDKICYEKRECKAGYDTEELYGPCIGGKRLVSYHWRAGANCKSENASLPVPREENCTCVPGTYVRDKTTWECGLCPAGYFTDGYNMQRCSKCQAGRFVPQTHSYENMVRFPEDMKSDCENVGSKLVDFCEMHIGWTVSEKVLVVDPDVPTGANFVLRKLVSVVQDPGRLSFKYTVQPGSETQFQLRVDGLSSSNRVLPPWSRPAANLRGERARPRDFSGAGGPCHRVGVLEVDPAHWSCGETDLDQDLGGGRVGGAVRGVSQGQFHPGEQS